MEECKTGEFDLWKVFTFCGSSAAVHSSLVIIK